MLYREVGQYKTSYAADMAVFPILQDRIGIVVILLIAFVVIPLIGNDFLLNAVLIPFLIFALAAIGLNLLTGYTGLLSLGTGAFMGVGAYACLKLTTDLSAREHHHLDYRFGIFLRRRRRAVRIAVAAHQGLLSRGGDAGGAILPRMVLHPRSLAVQLQRLGRDRGAFAHDLRRSGHRADRDLADPLSGCADHRRGDDVDRLEPRSRPHRSHVDVGARHGPRRRT